MSQDIQSLIQKIQQEGIAAAQEQARQIVAQASEKAAAMITAAQKEAKAITVSAQEALARERLSSDASLAQAARNVLINVRQEIAAMLRRIVALDVQKALQSPELAQIIAGLINKYPFTEGDRILVSLSKDDCARIEKNVFAALKEAVKTRVVLQSSENVKAGFTISYDAGKSHFDFTDAALTDYIGAYLDPKLHQIMRQNLSQSAK